jgi:hypothetical protein
MRFITIHLLFQFPDSFGSSQIPTKISAAPTIPAKDKDSPSQSQPVKTPPIGCA